ncbi:MAG TPA: hypothetical protein VGG72_13855 [Bryobacteraceae bacterium]|jgi:hypothetical protein
MANRSGSVYALTTFSPLLQKAPGEESPALSLRRHLAQLPADESSPFSRVSSTHIARLSVLDDVVFLGEPLREEHLQSRYLVFESNFDGDLEAYLARMAREIPQETDAVWRHCLGYPGTARVPDFVAYMKKCQIKTDYYFAAVKDKTVQQTLRALAAQRAVARFIEEHQGRPVAELQRAFLEFKSKLDAQPTPAPGGRSVTELAQTTEAGS